MSTMHYISKKHVKESGIFKRNVYVFVNIKAILTNVKSNITSNKIICENCRSFLAFYDIKSFFLFQCLAGP